MKRKVREFEANDVDLMINYFWQADHRFLAGMGVAPEKLPLPEVWREILFEDLAQPFEGKKFYYLLWEIDETPVGHSNINKIVYGKEAYMHLHLWHPDKRQRGQGTYFIQESIARYFEKFHLQTLFCEPYAQNPAPNKTLAKVGFELLKTYQATPGWLSFEQPVNRWILSREKWLQRKARLPDAKASG